MALALGALSAIAAAAAIPSLAATARPTRTAAAKPVATVLTEHVSRAGLYTVVVTVPAPSAAETVSVFVAGQSKHSVPVAGGYSAALAFFVHLRRGSYTVRTLSAAGPIHVGVAAALQVNPAAGSTGVTGTTGTTGASGASGTVITGPPRGPYTHLVWSDEFNDASGTPPDPGVWNEDLGGDCGQGTLSTDTTLPANASDDGSGDLAITAQRAAGGPGYTSAQLDTKDKFSFSYGELEARIALPAGSGLCSGFWMVGDSANPECFPGCGEIDVLEAITRFPDMAIATLHGPVIGSSNYQQWEQWVTANTALTGTFHTYGLIWQPNRLTWTLDGVPYASASPASLPSSARWVFSGNSFHILLSLAVGGWPGAPGAKAAFPASLRVDWVRLYN